MSSPDQLGGVTPGPEGPEAHGIFPAVDRGVVRAAEEAVAWEIHLAGESLHGAGDEFGEQATHEVTELREAELVEPGEVATWTERAMQRVREAGSRGTWAGRRGLRDRTSHAHPKAEEPTEEGKPVFKGRYQGPASLTRGRLFRVLNEYGATDVLETRGEDEQIETAA